MNTKKRGLDKETIIACALIAIAESIGIIFLGLVVLGVDINDCNSTILLGAYSLLTGGIWGILLCRNC